MQTREFLENRSKQLKSSWASRKFLHFHFLCTPSQRDVTRSMERIGKIAFTKDPGQMSSTNTWTSLHKNLELSSRIMLNEKWIFFFFDSLYPNRILIIIKLIFVHCAWLAGFTGHNLQIMINGICIYFVLIKWDKIGWLYQMICWLSVLPRSPPKDPVFWITLWQPQSERLQCDRGIVYSGFFNGNKFWPDVGHV